MSAHALPSGSSAAPASQTMPTEVSSGNWKLEALAGRFVEIVGGPATAELSLCARLIREAQRAGCLAAWVGDRRFAFFPPDFAASGVDLAALAVVWVEGDRNLWRACDTLLRSSGFALVVANLNAGIDLSFNAQTRLAGLAHRYAATLVAITRATNARGSMVSLRVETTKRFVGHDVFACEIQGVKDKRGVPGWTHYEFLRGADGLC